jgi:hypothetical protein
MKHFIFRLDYGKPDRSGNRSHTCMVWQVTRDKKTRRPQLREIARRVYTFESDFQAVLTTLEPLKPNPLPRKAYTRNQYGGHVYCHPYLLADAGIAVFSQV